MNGLVLLSEHTENVMFCVTHFGTSLLRSYMLVLHAGVPLTDIGPLAGKMPTLLRHKASAAWQTDPLGSA